jgi:hypothetical protein
MPITVQHDVGSPDTFKRLTQEQLHHGMNLEPGHGNIQHIEHGCGVSHGSTQQHDRPGYKD